jgi:CO/xanthine dehydrogenase Mo-binding subunit
VKLVYTRKEVFTNGGCRVPQIIYIKDGVKKDGTFVARQMRVILASGAYENNIGVVTRNCAFGAIGTYRVPNFKWDSYGVYTNEPPGCSFRGLGSTQVVWAIESHIDMLAKKLGIDPVEIRRRNILQEGEPNVTGEITHSIGARECLEKMAEFMKFDSKIEFKGLWRKGKGIALGNKYSMAPTQAIARVKILEDESIEVYHSADENGQGCNTVAAQIAAEEFGIPVDRVRVIFSDTLYCPYFAGGSTSSRVTYNLGNAVRLACKDAKHRLFRIAANRLKVDVFPGELATKGGEIYVKSNPGKKIRIAEVFLGYRGDRPGGYGSYTEGGEIIGTDTWIQDYVPEDPETGQIDPGQAAQGKRLNAFWAHTAKAVEVAVNVETGQIKVLRCGAATDMGQPINPKMCEQQAEGGIVMGIGDALYEEMQMDKGFVTNPNFTDYKVPSTSDVPMIQDVKSLIAAAPHKDGPFGAKGFGEGAMIGMEPAIGNAVYNAIGVRVKDLPITPEKILRATKEKGE